MSNKDSITQGLNHKEEIQKRLDSKSALGDFVGHVYDCAANFLCSSGTFEAIVSALLNQPHTKESLVISELANVFLKYNSTVSFFDATFVDLCEPNSFLSCVLDNLLFSHGGSSMCSQATVTSLM